MEVVAMVLLADFITGVIHWWEDTYGLPTWWLIGMAVIEPNIEHHENPTAMLRGTYWSRNYQTIVSAAPVVALCWWMGWPVVAVAFALAAAMGNEVHAWNHGLAMPWWAAKLQEMGLLQSKRQHGSHHKRPWDRTYCTLTNVVNPVIDPWLWRVMEFVIPVPVRRGSPERRGF